LRSDRKRLHRAIAESIEHESSGRRESPILLARHWDEAGEDRRALDYYLRAGEQAAGLYANKEALMAYDRALELMQTLGLPVGEQLDVYVRRGRVLELEGDYAAALASYQALEQLALQEEDRSAELQALIRTATLFATPNKMYDAERALALSHQALELAREIHDRPAQARVLWNLSLACFFAGQNDQALQYGQESIAIARELNLREQLAYSLNDIARPYIFKGRNQDAFAAMTEAQALWREVNNLPMLADNLIGVGMSSVFTGDYISPRASIREGLQIVCDLGNVWGQSYAHEALGILYAQTGEFALALEHLHEGARLGRQVNYLDAQFDGFVHAALVYRSLGAHAQAVQVIDGMLASPDLPKDWTALPYSILSILYADEQDLVRARAALVQADSGYALNLGPLQAGFVNLARVLILLQERQAAAALELARSFASDLARGGVRPFLTIFLNFQALALEHMERIEEAVSAAESARREAQETSHRTYLWEVLAVLTRLYALQGETAKAQEARDQARVEIQFIADNAPPDLRDTFLNRAEVRELMRS
jgi:tetratricopeptide (TPR) repeat protein